MRNPGQSLEKYVCRIIDSDGKVRGTGFFIRPDGYVVTCYHVIKACKGNVRVGIFGEPEPIQSEIVREYESYDVAVLKINREDCPVLPLSTEWKLGDKVFSHGFSIQHSLKEFLQGFPMKPSELSGTTTVESGLNMLVLENTEVDFGLSGAPAVDERTGNVIGILRLKYQEGQKALVIPAERLFEKWVEFKKYHESLLEKYKIIPEIDIPTIESVLRKDKIKDGEFFRKEPVWIDFEQHFIIERKEVDEIIGRMEKDQIQLVLGAPASGKSIILKNIGFKLANKGKQVYIVQLKEHPDNVKLFETILKMIDENAVFIVDDAHLSISDCENLVRNFEDKGKGKLIIGSRETREVIKGTTTKSSLLEYLQDRCIKVKAEEVTEDMIKCFLKIKHKEYNFSDERIKTVSENLGKYKKDLWYLSWALKSYNPEKNSVEESEIYENIQDKIKEINAENVFLPLSVFYRFEIPVEQKFLEKQLDIKRETIDQLKELSEIVEIVEIRKPIMLSLHHSSLAELYFSTYLMYPSIGEEIKEKILNGKEEKYLEYCSFYRYITITDPRNAVNVIINLRRDLRNKKGGLTLLKKLAEDYEIRKLIETGIEKEEDIVKIGRCVWDIINESQVGWKLVNSINIDTLLAKIEKEQDIEKIGRGVLDIANASQEVKLKLVNNINIDTLSAKIEKEGDIGKIGSCVSSIASASKEVGLKLVNSINLYALSAKIEKEKNIGKIEWCVGSIARASQEVALRLVDALSSKIEKEQDIEKIGRGVMVITKGNKDFAKEIINRLNPKLRKELKNFKKLF